MSRSLLKLGVVAIVAAVVLTIAASNGVLASYVQVRDGSLARYLFALGAVASVLGFSMDWLGRAKCRRCGKPAVSGSVFCRMHHDRLEQQGRVAAARRVRDHRGY